MSEDPDTADIERQADLADVVGDAEAEGRLEFAQQIRVQAEREADASATVRIMQRAGMFRASASMPAAKRMTPEMRRRIAKAARAERARRSLAHFFQLGWHVLEPEVPLEFNWHHRLVCDVLQAMFVDWIRKQRDPAFRQRVRNVIFNLPPGTSKSRLISVFAPAWMWLHRPSFSFLCLSSNPDVAVRDAMFARDLVTSEWYRASFGVTWEIRDDVDAKGKYRNTMGGERTSRGFTSKIVGNRADGILIDDPNDMHDVFSEASRRETNSKFDNAIYNRVNDQRSSLRMMIQQRGHMLDLTGHWRAIAKPGDLLHVPLPIEFDPENRCITPFGSDPRTVLGESLHPVRFTPEFIASERLRLGTFGFEAQYNQRPQILEGGMFKRRYWNFFRPPGHEPIVLPRPAGCHSRPPRILEHRIMPESAHWSERIVLDWMLLSVDATFGSTNADASNVGLLCIGGRGADRFIFDDRTDARDFTATCDAIEALCRDYPASKRVLIERRANGQAVIDVLGKRIAGLIPVEPMGKMVGANAVLPAVEAGNWYLLEGASWLRPFVDEFALFNKGPKDDRVDALSQAAAYAERMLGALAKWQALAK